MKKTGENFDVAVPEYSQALQSSGFKHTIMYKFSQSSPYCSNNTKKKRKRNIWFNSPFSKNVATNVEKEFSLNCLNNNRYHKIFNKQNVKFSYSCVPNMEASSLNTISSCSIGFHRRTLKHHPAIAAISVIACLKKNIERSE